MMVLAIDTATRYAGLALYDGQSVVAEFAWQSSRNHTTTLMPNLTRMLDQQKLTVGDLTGLAVALGPGSFTGLRIAWAVAKGLALAQGLSLVGVPTLDIVAYSCMSLPPGQTAPLCALLQAGRGRFCIANYRWREGAFHRQGDYRVVELDEVGADVEEPTVFCGELDAKLEQALRARLGNRAIVAPPAARLRRPGYLAELGYERLARGECSTDP